jgi:hypothetical protein
LTQEVRLVVLDGTSDLLTLQKLVVEGEDIEFVSRSGSLTQLILNQNCELSLDFCSTLGVSGFGLLPLSSSLNRGIKLFNVGYEGIVGFSHRQAHPDLHILVLLGEGLRNDLFKLMVFSPENKNEVKAL